MSMEADGSAPMGKGQRLTADWRPMRYLGNSHDGDALFEHDLAPAFEHAWVDQLTGVPGDMSSLMDRLDMPPTGFEMHDDFLAATGFGAAACDEAVMASQKVAASNDNKSPAPVKTTWTEKEDSILREMVEYYGERKWSVIAQSLPGRIGKQCRERWINHLRPDIKQNDMWTEEDDKMLIQAHRNYGNRWSTIAKHLPGRSENAIKNHWNATLRSLKANRRLKKKKSEQAPPGQFSILEEYIRSLLPDDVAPAAPQEAPPSPQHLAYGGLQSPAVHTAPATSSAIPTTAEMSFHGEGSAGGSSSNQGTINLNMQLQLPDLNTIGDSREFSLNYQMYPPAPAPQLQLATQHPRQASSILDLHQYEDYIRFLQSNSGTLDAGVSSSSINPGANGYYREAARTSAGGSGVPAVDSGNIQLASRGFFMPYNNGV